MYSKWREPCDRYETRPNSNDCSSVSLTKESSGEKKRREDAISHCADSLTIAQGMSCRDSSLTTSLIRPFELLTKTHLTNHMQR